MWHEMAWRRLYAMLQGRMFSRPHREQDSRRVSGFFSCVCLCRLILLAGLCGVTLPAGRCLCPLSSRCLPCSTFSSHAVAWLVTSTAPLPLLTTTRRGDSVCPLLARLLVRGGPFLDLQMVVSPELFPPTFHSSYGSGGANVGAIGIMDGSNYPILLELRVALAYVSHNGCRLQPELLFPAQNLRAMPCSAIGPLPKAGMSSCLSCANAQVEFHLPQPGLQPDRPDEVPITASGEVCVTEAPLTHSEHVTGPQQRKHGEGRSVLGLLLQAIKRAG